MSFLQLVGLSVEDEQDVVEDTGVAQTKASSTDSRTHASDIVEANDTRGQHDSRGDSAAAVRRQSLSSIAQKTNTEYHDAAEHMVGGTGLFSGPMYETLYGSQPWENFQKLAQNQPELAETAEKTFEQQEPNPMLNLIAEMQQGTQLEKPEDIPE